MIAVVVSELNTAVPIDPPICWAVFSWFAALPATFPHTRRRALGEVQAASALC